MRKLLGGRTRIVESGYWRFAPRWLQLGAAWLFIEPKHWVMQTRQFANLKQRVERPSAAR